MRPSILILLILSFLFCSQSKEKHPTKKDFAIALIAINSPTPINNCVSDYKQLNPLFNTYYSNMFVNYPLTCKNAIIGDSTMDLARQNNFYDSSKTNNYAVSGNTACDYLQQMEYINCIPENVLIATTDGNGVLRDVPSNVSISTIKQVVDRSRVKWNPKKIIVIGIHPILVTSANRNKNLVNLEISKMENICYINPLPIFGASETDLPKTEYMLDSIHYNSTIHNLYKNQILNQCGVSL